MWLGSVELTVKTTLMDFSSTSKLLLTRRISENILPLLGFVSKSPSVVPLIVRPLPGCRNNPSNLGCKSKIAFRSRGFSPPQRFAPLNQVRVYCNPCRPWGSLRFQIPSTWTSQVLRNFPRNASTPRRIPLVSSSTASLRPLSLLLLLHNFAFHTPNQTLRRALARAEIVGQNGKPRYLLISRASAEAVAHANFVPVRQNVPDLMLPLDESSFPTKLGATRAPLPGMVCVEPLAEASSPALPYQTPTKVSYWCVL